jgi:hypothetical protein
VTVTGCPMTTVAFVAAADKALWSAVVVAALGSSALGAIIGGLTTTWLRGRIEGDAEWRTRLLDSAAALEAALSDLLLSHGKLAKSLRKAEQPSETDLDDARANWRLAKAAAGLVELLFTRQSSTFVTANDVLLLVRDMRWAIGGQMDLLSPQTLMLGITRETDRTEAALRSWDAACTRFDTFADAVNEHVRSAHLRKRLRLRGFL